MKYFSTFIRNNLIAQAEHDLDKVDCEMQRISIHVSGIAPVYIGAFYHLQKTDADKFILPTNALFYQPMLYNVPK